LSNSVKYSGGVLSVEVHVEFEADQVAITVADKGIGIPEKDQKQLFKLFHRGSNTKHVPGTGLGLAIVQRFSDVLNGKLTFHSREGEGTQFTLALPYELPYAA
jgi:signal transduction histidine kinase